MLPFPDLWSYGEVDIFYDHVNMTMTNCKACLMYAFLTFSWSAGKMPSL